MSENRVKAQLKKAVVKRANGCCEYCRSQERFAIQAFSVEHFLTESEDFCTGCAGTDVNQGIGLFKKLQEEEYLDFHLLL